MMGQAEWIKRKRPRSREHLGGREGVGGSLCLLSEFRKTSLALPCQLPVNQRLSVTQSGVGATLPLRASDPRHTGAHRGS